jgi:hypothetical protein
VDSDHWAEDNTHCESSAQEPRDDLAATADPSTPLRSGRDDTVLSLASVMQSGRKTKGAIARALGWMPLILITCGASPWLSGRLRRGLRR